MKLGKCGYCVILTGLALFSVSIHAMASATNNTCEILQKYCDYLASHPINDYLGNSELYDVEWIKDTMILNVSFLDLDNDGELELQLTGRGASANSLAGIIDIIDGEPTCVLSEWAHVFGRYYDEITNQEYLAVSEGNGAEFWHEFRICLYDDSWNRTVLASSSWTDGEADYSYDRYGNRISHTDYSSIWCDIDETCTLIDPVYTVSANSAEGMTEYDAIEGIRSYMDELIIADTDSIEQDDNGAIDTWEGIIDSFLADSSVGGCWFCISDTYEKGIAVRSDTSTKADLLCRLPYGTGFFADKREGEWVHTTVNGCDGWVNIDYICIADDYYADNAGVGSISGNGSWYYISNTNEKGIAVRSEPSADSKLLCRISYGTEFWVEAFCGSWGFTTVNGYTGWIDTDYAAQFNKVESGAVGRQGQLTEEQATQALTNYIDESYGLDTVYEYNGWICFDEKLEEAYRFIFRSYTGAYANFYVYISSGDIYIEQKNPFTYEYEELEYVGNAFEYIENANYSDLDEGRLDLFSYLGENLETASKDFSGMRSGVSMGTYYFLNDEVYLGSRRSDKVVTYISVNGRNSYYEILGIHTDMDMAEASEQLAQKGFLETTTEGVYWDEQGDYVDLRRLEDEERPIISLTVLYYPGADTRMEIACYYGTTFEMVHNDLPELSLSTAEGKVILSDEFVTFTGDYEQGKDVYSAVVNSIEVTGTEAPYCIYGLYPGIDEELVWECGLPEGGSGERVDPMGNIVYLYGVDDEENPVIRMHSSS